jgi:hypothetical protein
MCTPTVTEITRPPEPVVHDDFIDDLAAAARRWTAGRQSPAMLRTAASIPAPSSSTGST